MNNQTENLGWIKLYRTIIDSKIWASPEGLKIWMWILLKANHSDEPRYVQMKVGKGSTTVTLFQGQFIFGRKIAAQELDMDENLVYRWVKKLSSPAYNCMISEQPKNAFTIIQVNNWRKYQVQSEQPMNNQRTTNEHRQELKRINKNLKENLESLDLKANSQEETKAIDCIQSNKFISAKAEITLLDKSIAPSIDNINCKQEKPFWTLGKELDIAIESSMNDIDFGNDFEL